MATTPRISPKSVSALAAECSSVDSGGGKGFLIGGAVGATVTVTHWLGKHRSAMLPAGTELVMELSRPMSMNVVVASSGQ